jgi:peptidoglycan/xylan/chitin deacetylase (PgdA/CDA1 family)
MAKANPNEWITISSGLPVPLGSDVPRPSGKPGNLVILNWAGFKSAASYTFDDAQPSHIAHYEELQATGVHMTFYVSTNVNGIPNSDAVWAKAVKDGHEIGNHTVSHPHADLTGSCFGKALTSQEAEIDECAKYIIQHFGQSDVWTMAAPFGDIGWVETARSKLFLNRGVSNGTIGPNDNSDPFNLPCYMANTGETGGKFNGMIDSARSDGRWLILLFHTINPTSENWYAPVDIGEIIKSIDHSKSFGDVWNDTLANVGAYWVGQKLLSSLTPTTSGEDKTWTWTLPAHFPKGKYLRVRVDGGILKQEGKTLPWDKHGYYEVALDAGSLTLTL